MQKSNIYTFGHLVTLLQGAAPPVVSSIGCNLGASPSTRPFSLLFAKNLVSNMQGVRIFPMLRHRLQRYCHFTFLWFDAPLICLHVTPI